MEAGGMSLAMAHMQCLNILKVFGLIQMAGMIARGMVHGTVIQQDELKDLLSNGDVRITLSLE